MILYHASNVEVKKPMLVESNRMLDFGMMDAMVSANGVFRNFLKRSMSVTRKLHTELHQYRDCYPKILKMP